VTVKLVQPNLGPVTITHELDLEFQLLSSYRQATSRTLGPGAWTSPYTVGSPIRKFSITKHLAGLLSEASLVHVAHLEGDTPKPEGSSQMPQGPTPDAPTGNPMEGDAIVTPI